MKDEIWLYVGCGNHRLAGFTHVEINPWKQFKRGGNVGPPEILADIVERIPLETASVSLIFSRATIEHLTYPELVSHLVECNRLLVDHGTVRMVLPSLDKMVKDYLDKIVEIPTEHDPNLPVDNYTDAFIAKLLYHDHYYLHNLDTLSRVLEKTGFGNAREAGPGDTAVSPASDILHSAEVNRPRDIIMEATKVAATELPRLSRNYPRNPISFLLARLLNIRVSSHIRRRPHFPHRMWFLEKILRARPVRVRNTGDASS